MAKLRLCKAISDVKMQLTVLFSGLQLLVMWFPILGQSPGCRKVLIQQNVEMAAIFGTRCLRWSNWIFARPFLMLKCNLPCCFTMFYHVLPCFTMFWAAVYHTRAILSGCISHETYFERLYTTQDLFWTAVYHTRPILSGCISHKTYFEQLYITWDLFCAAVYHTRPILSGCILHETYFERLYTTRDLFWAAVYHTRPILSGCISHESYFERLDITWKWQPFLHYVSKMAKLRLCKAIFGVKMQFTMLFSGLQLLAT